MSFVAPRKLNINDIPSIVNRLNSAESTINEEAERFKVHPATISGLRRRHMEEDWFDLRQLSALTEDKDIILELSECVPIPELADKFDVNSSTMRNFIHKHKSKPVEVDDGIRNTTLSEIHNKGVELDGDIVRLKRKRKMTYIMLPESEYLRLKSNTASNTK